MENHDTAQLKRTCLFRKTQAGSQIHIISEHKHAFAYKSCRGSELSHWSQYCFAVLWPIQNTNSDSVALPRLSFTSQFSTKYAAGTAVSATCMHRSFAANWNYVEKLMHRHGNVVHVQYSLKTRDLDYQVVYLRLLWAWWLAMLLEENVQDTCNRCTFIEKMHNECRYGHSSFNRLSHARKARWGGRQITISRFWTNQKVTLI